MLDTAAWTSHYPKGRFLLLAVRPGPFFFNCVFRFGFLVFVLLISPFSPGVSCFLVSFSCVAAIDLRSRECVTAVVSRCRNFTYTVNNPFSMTR